MCHSGSSYYALTTYMNIGILLELTTIGAIKYIEDRLDNRNDWINIARFGDLCDIFNHSKASERVTKAARACCVKRKISLICGVLHTTLDLIVKWCQTSTLLCTIAIGISHRSSNYVYRKSCPMAVVYFV